uniref:Uncharacterized protein n=1 Tax=Anguilla anguilla TaxID=7936 RepID=A0A0E9VNA2_ANGAN
MARCPWMPQVHIGYCYIDEKYSYSPLCLDFYHVILIINQIIM